MTRRNVSKVDLAVGAALVMVTVGMGAAGCSLLGGGKLGLAACPALGTNVDALAANYSPRAEINAKVKTFVQAAKDMAQASARMEHLAANACLRMGADLGLPPARMQPRDGPGGAAEGACEALGAHIDGILRQGIAVNVAVTPPRCVASAEAQARCSGQCNVAADAECAASCRAHANVHAQCEPARIAVQATQGAHLAGRLVATLQAHLPALIEAQITLGQRLAQDAKVVAQVGANLPKIAGNAGAQAAACIGAAADMAASASVRVNVSFHASASVSGRVGVR